MAASTNSVAAAASNAHTNAMSRSTNLFTWLAVAMPRNMPTPNAVTTTPQAAWFLSRPATKIGPSASTAPTAANATTMPPVMAEAIESSRRNRTPSTMSCHTLLRSNRPVRPCTGAGNAMRLTMNAENPKVHASSQQGERLGAVAQERHPLPDALADPRQHGEHRAAQRQRGVRAHQAQRVRVRELTPGHHVRAGRRRAPGSTAGRGIRSRTTAGRSPTARP